MRDQAFPPGLFGEPAWDLLLDLYIAANEPGRVSVIAASIAGSVAAEDTRWLRLLEEHGLIERVDAGRPMGRAIVALSAAAFDQMTRLLIEHRERPN